MIIAFQDIYVDREPMTNLKDYKELYATVKRSNSLSVFENYSNGSTGLQQVPARPLHLQSHSFMHRPLICL